MNNDLISREDLKTALQSKVDPYNEGLFIRGYNIGIKTAIEMLDNATPFEITEEQAIDKLHEAGWLIKHDKEMTERPHGKWIDHWSEDLQKLGYRQCSKCKAGCQIYEHGTRKSEVPWIDGQQYTLQRICNFCPNCGADMREEADNDN